MRYGDCQPSLPRASWAYQCQQTRLIVDEQRIEGGEIAFPPDKRSNLRGQTDAKRQLIVFGETCFHVRPTSTIDATRKEACCLDSTTSLANSSYDERVV